MKVTGCHHFRVTRMRTSQWKKMTRAIADGIEALPTLRFASAVRLEVQDGCPGNDRLSVAEIQSAAIRCL